MLVLASHMPGEGFFRSQTYSVVHQACPDPFDYWRFLDGYWDCDRTIVNVEHDMELTDAHLDEFAACPHALCSWSYQSHWVSTHKPHDVIAAGSGDRRGGGTPGYLQGGEEWAAWSAIGLVKIAPEARIAELRKEPWQTVELAVEDAVARPWHMHWGSDLWPESSSPPLPHHHW